MTPGDTDPDSLVCPEDKDLESLSSYLQGMSVNSTISPRVSRSPSPANSLPTFSPCNRRRYGNKFNARHPEDVLGSSPPVRAVLRLAKDPVQPSSGSISDLCSEISVDGTEEEVDFFNLDSPMRPRAKTCPENRAWQRRAKVRNLRRPPTPPLEVEKPFSQFIIKDKLGIPVRDLPEVPESGSAAVQSGANG